MIKKIERDVGQNYYNILQLAVLFILNELLIIASFFGIYNENDQTFNIRKLIWWSILLIILIGFIATIISTCALMWIFIISII